MGGDSLGDRMKDYEQRAFRPLLVYPYRELVAVIVTVIKIWAV